MLEMSVCKKNLKPVKIIIILIILYVSAEDFIFLKASHSENKTPWRIQVFIHTVDNKVEMWWQNRLLQFKLELLDFNFECSFTLKPTNHTPLNRKLAQQEEN